jgi:hypothetical protein
MEFITAGAPGVHPTAAEGEVDLAAGAARPDRMLDLDRDLRAVNLDLAGK